MLLSQMTNNETAQQYCGGENFSLRDVLLKGKKLNLHGRVNYFSRFLNNLNDSRQNLCMRQVNSVSDREIEITDPFTGKKKKLLMFGSNNYLGLASHPHVRIEVEKCIRTYGVGIGGPPLLNGYTKLHHELEERLAQFKHKEAAMIYSTGYGANVGLVTGLINRNDRLIYDEYSHASFCDGIKMANLEAYKFRHNNISGLTELLSQHSASGTSDVFVGVEGVYSMDGDIAPLDKIAALTRKHGAILMIDDAHGTGVMGKTGSGTAEHFGVSDDIDIIMGTFSKTFGVVGGFVCSTKPVIDYLRFFARSYMFSASLPPMVISAVLAGLDVIETEPGLRERLMKNVKYALKGIKSLGINAETQSAIIALHVPESMNIRKAAYKFHELGIFVNSVEYPAVPLNQQRFRISLMANHTREDISRLVQSIKAVWAECNSDKIQTKAA
jgi:glycine C-acetyltransferase